jgi:hypothetical protein
VYALEQSLSLFTQIEGTFTTVKVRGVHPEPSPDASLMKHFSAFGTVVAIKVLPPQGKLFVLSTYYLLFCTLLVVLYTASHCVGVYYAVWRTVLLCSL